MLRYISSYLNFCIWLSAKFYLIKGLTNNLLHTYPTTCSALVATYFYKNLIRKIVNFWIKFWKNSHLIYENLVKNGISKFTEPSLLIQVDHCCFHENKQQESQGFLITLRWTSTEQRHMIQKIANTIALVIWNRELNCRVQINALWIVIFDTFWCFCYGKIFVRIENELC